MYKLYELVNNLRIIRFCEEREIRAIGDIKIDGELVLELQIGIIKQISQKES